MDVRSFGEQQQRVWDAQQIKELEQEIAALKAALVKAEDTANVLSKQLKKREADLRAVVIAARVVAKHHRLTPRQEWLDLDDALALPGVVKVLEERT